MAISAKRHWGALRGVAFQAAAPAFVRALGAFSKRPWFGLSRYADMNVGTAGKNAHATKITDAGS
jgi:hypothetical protein